MTCKVCGELALFRMTARYEGGGLQPAGFLYFCDEHEEEARAMLQAECPEAVCNIYSMIVGITSCVRCTDAADYTMLYRREGEEWWGPRVAREHLCSDHMESARAVLDKCGTPPGFTGYRVIAHTAYPQDRLST
jgi:hypothetical protein